MADERTIDKIILRKNAFIVISCFIDFNLQNKQCKINTFHI